jgi:hypothetical protein
MSDKISDDDVVVASIFLFGISLTVSVGIPIFAVAEKTRPLIVAIFIFFTAFLIVYRILIKKYRKQIKPVNGILEAIIHDKSALFPPKSVLIMYKDIMTAGKKIALIRKRMAKTADYIAMLAQSKKDGVTNGMISKQNKYYNYFFDYYDNYCSLYLDMRFQFYMTVIKDVLIAAKKIYVINVKSFIDTVKTDIKCMGYVLKSKYSLPGRSMGDSRDKAYNDSRREYSENKFAAVVEGFEIMTDIESTIAWFFDDTNKKSKKQPSGQNENEEKYDMVLEKTNESIRAIKEKIQEAAAYLITVQSNKIIGDTSPIDEENALNMQMKEKGFNTIIEYSKTLDDEYDRFMAEVELSENNGSQNDGNFIRGGA